MKIWHMITLCFGAIMFLASIMPIYLLEGDLISYLTPPYYGFIEPFTAWFCLIGALFFLSKNQSVRNIGAGLALFGAVVTFLFFLSFFY